MGPLPLVRGNAVNVRRPVARTSSPLDLRCITVGLRKGETMFTLDKAGDVLGLTPRHVYRRIAAARPLLGEHLRTGARRRVDPRRRGFGNPAPCGGPSAVRGDGGGCDRPDCGGGGGKRGEEVGRAAGEPPEASGPWHLLLREKGRPGHRTRGEGPLPPKPRGSPRGPPVREGPKPVVVAPRGG